jgi:Tol biopolymer transport system component
MTALVALAVVHFRSAPKANSLVRFSITAPDNVLLWHQIPSPDGRMIALTTHGGEFGNKMLLRHLDSSNLEPIPGTEGALVPFWSPDSRYLGYFGSKMMKIDLSSPSGPGRPEAICDSGLGGATWSRDNVIVFGGLGRALSRVSASGGKPEALTKLDSTRMETSHMWPYFLPDGRHFLYTIVSKISTNSGIFVGSLDSPIRKQLLADPSQASFVTAASGTGWLVFIHRGRLTFQRFDPRRLELSGESRSIADVEYNPEVWASGSFGISESGVLAFQSPYVGPLKRLTWFDRDGKATGTVGDPVLMTDWQLDGLDGGVALSPDGKRVALAAAIDPTSQSLHIVLIDATRGVATRLTAHPGDDPSEHAPIWAADGKRVIFSSTREGMNDLYWKDAEGGGAEELLLKSGSFNGPNSCSPDGRFLAYTEDSIVSQRAMLLPLAGDRKPAALEKIGQFGGAGIFSPDGTWITFETRGEIFVHAINQVETGSRSNSGVSREADNWQISSGGGRLARWRPDGRELYYLGSDGKLIAVEVKLGSAVQAGVRRSLFTVPAATTLGGYAVTADGQRFLIPVPVGERIPSSVTVMLNWTNALGNQ